MATRRPGKLKLYIFLLIFFGGLLFLFFNEFGVLKYLRLQNEVKSLNEHIEALETENKNLQAEIDSLQKKIPAKIERTAREKYNLKREGEKVIKMIEE